MDYDLALEGPPVPPDRFEPNDSRGTATNLGTAGNHTIAQLSMHNQADVDYFRVTPPADGNLALTSSSIAPPASLIVLLFNSAVAGSSAL
jgi:hypothetical protein